MGIDDDVCHTSLAVDRTFVTESEDVVGCIFHGLGADGTVGANKNSIKIIGEGTPGYAQGFFVYDSKKSGSRTTSHLRFGPHPIRSAYLVQKARFIACHQFQLLERIEMLAEADEGAVFLINSPFGPAEVWDHLPQQVQRAVIRKRIRVFVIDADRVAADAGMSGRINTVMQTCFFAISGVLPREEAIFRIKEAVLATYGRKGTKLVDQNFAAIDRALDNLHEVDLSARIVSATAASPVVPDHAPEFVKRVTATMIAGRGDDLPVSALPPDGTYPSGTSRWEKRNIADAIPVWSPQLCIQCGNCVMVCPHASIRARLCDDTCWRMRRPASFRRHWPAAGSPGSGSPCRCRSRTARAVNCVSKPVPSEVATRASRAHWR